MQPPATGWHPDVSFSTNDNVKFRAIALHGLLTPLLLLFLLLSQQLGIAHSVTHLSHSSHLSHPAESGSPRDEQLPGDLHCATCLAFAAIGAALNDVTYAVDVGAAKFVTETGGRASSPLDDPLCAFQPRAPPLLS